MDIIDEHLFYPLLTNRGWRKEDFINLANTFHKILKDIKND